MKDIECKQNCADMLASFRAILRKYNEFLSAQLDEYDLSPNEIVVLSSLQNVSSASQIAKEADVSKALVSRSVKLLKEKGLIDITISALDKREQDLRLTDSGEELAKVIDEANLQFADKALSHIFSDEPIRVTQMILQIIINNFNVEGEYGSGGDGE